MIKGNNQVLPSFKQAQRSNLDFFSMSPNKQQEKTQRNQQRFIVNSSKIINKAEKTKTLRIRHGGQGDYDDENHDKVNFPDITSSPSYINTYLAEAKQRQTVASYMMNKTRDQFNQSHILEQKDVLGRRNKYDRTKYFNNSTIQKHKQDQTTISPSISRIQRSLDSDQSLKSLDQSILKVKREQSNRDKNFSPDLNSSIPQIKTSKHNITFSDVLMKSKSTLKDYQSINPRHFPMIKPSIRVSIDDQEEDIIFGETQYHNPFLDTNIKSTVKLHKKESIDDHEYQSNIQKQNQYQQQSENLRDSQNLEQDNEESIIKNIKSPKGKELTIGRFKVDIALSQDRDRFEKQWMKQSNPRVYQQLQAREDFELKMIIKKKKRVEIMNLTQTHQL